MKWILTSPIAQLERGFLSCLFSKLWVGLLSISRKGTLKSRLLKQLYFVPLLTNLPNCMIMPLLYNHPLTLCTNRRYWGMKMLLSRRFHPSAPWGPGRALRPCPWSPSQVWHHRFFSPLLVPHEVSRGNLSPLLTAPQPEHIQHRDILAGKLQPALIAWVQSESFQMLIN